MSFSLQERREIEDRRYREYLQQAKAAEAAREKELDRLLDEEVNRQWQKRLEQWAREKEARQEMMRQCIEERKEQVRQRGEDRLKLFAF